VKPNWLAIRRTEFPGQWGFNFGWYVGNEWTTASDLIRYSRIQARFISVRDHNVRHVKAHCSHPGLDGVETKEEDYQLEGENLERRQSPNRSAFILKRDW